MKNSHAVAWIVWSIVGLVVLVGGVIYLTSDHTDPNARTVSSVIHENSGGTEQPEAGSAASRGQTSGVNGLLAALGMPYSSIGQVGTMQPKSDAKRTELQNMLDLAIQSGTMNDEEAAAVLKAFDNGLVEVAKGPLVVEENS